jgi:hypothetical protein
MSDLVVNTEAPIANPQRRGSKKGDAARRNLASQGALQIDSAIENAREIVGKTSDVVAQVYSSVPAMIEVEAAIKVEGLLPLIKAENDRRIQATKESVREALAESNQAAANFLKEFGIE